MRVSISLVLSLAMFLVVVDKATASVIQADLFAPGDGLLTRDQDNGRDWLDMTETLNLPYSGAIALTAPGQIYEGFLPATTSDVLALEQSAGINTSTTDFATNESAAGTLIGLLGLTRTIGNDTFSEGWLSTTLLFGGPPQRDTATVFRRPSISDAGASFNATNDSALSFAATWLYKPIPEPSTFALASLGVLGLSLGAWRRRTRA